MRVKKQKRHRRAVRFYAACFGFREPYKVLCDGTFVHHLIDYQITPADTALVNTLGASLKLFTNKVMNFITLFRRLNIRELVSDAPIYSSGSDASGEGLSLVLRRWATKKSAGSTKNGRDSKPKNLGVKKFGGERVIPGNIIVRQRGTRFHPGDYVGIGKDHTLYALKEGCVKFERNKLTGRKWVHVEPKEGHVLHPIYSIAADPGLKTAI